MSETFLIALISLLGGGTVTALVSRYLSRRKDKVDVRKAAAEAYAIESSTRQSEVVYYQKRVEETIKQMRLLEKQVTELKVYIGDMQTKYEQRVGELHSKIDGLKAELDRANRNLDTANETIAELRQEVKDGNKVITELRSEITQLLVDRAEKKQEDKEN